MTNEVLMIGNVCCRSQERVYLQQPLNNTVGPQIAADFVQFNWSWAAEHKKEFNWGPLTSNLLLIGQKVTKRLYYIHNTSY